VKLVLIGAPASGKGTQASLLSEYFQIPAVSTGVIIRREMEKGTKLGKLATELLGKGQLLPDPETLHIVENWIDHEINAKLGFLFDGFPRTIPQAVAFDEILKKRGLNLDAVIYLSVSRETIEHRILDRLQCTGCGAVFQADDDVSDGDSCPECGDAFLARRTDDSQEMLNKRLAEYEKKTAALVPFYEQHSPGLLKTIDGNRSSDKVLKSVLSALNSK
jgi:adenylate kinase